MAITTKELIETWHSDATVDEIAANYEVSRHHLHNAWRRLKMHGQLPQGPRGKHLATPSVTFDDPLLEALKDGKR